jgi:transposase
VVQRFFFGGVPQSILYDNTKIAVARILGDGKRQRTRVSGFSACGGARVGGRGK